MCTRWFGFVLCRGPVREFTPPYKVSIGDGGAMFRPHIRANGDLLDLNVIAGTCKFRCSASGFDLREAHQHKKTGAPKCSCFCGDPYGNRTPVSALRGPCLSLLTNGPCVIRSIIISLVWRVVKGFSKKS